MKSEITTLNELKKSVDELEEKVFENMIDYLDQKGFDVVPKDTPSMEDALRDNGLLVLDENGKWEYTEVQKVLSYLIKLGYQIKNPGFGVEPLSDDEMAVTVRVSEDKETNTMNYSVEYNGNLSYHDAVAIFENAKMKLMRDDMEKHAT